jgi:type II secretory pathway component PulF
MGILIGIPLNLQTALNIMKDAVNEEISSKNITGIMATVEGGKLVLILNKDKKI